MLSSSNARGSNPYLCNKREKGKKIKNKINDKNDIIDGWLLK
jgi:hypothetical protein